MPLLVITRVSLFMLFFSDLTSRKLWLPGVVALKTGKLNECGRCKVLTDSFNHWLRKTSRGKYEGGDAAWEEAKLRSYARSEIRFVEMQEGLCSELNQHQHECYMLAEKAEQMLENWWFQENHNSVNLHTWLCIETLKHCCPSHHFGESCLPCPLDKENMICSGHGRCDGEGTRQGNGLCICKRGYTGPYCEACSKNYYKLFEGSCERCDKACDGCSSAGPAACQRCNTGWKLDSSVCTDIDECATSICKSDQYCINKEGSYSCQTCDDSCKNCAGAGHKNCTSCKPTYRLWKNECISDNIMNEQTENAVNRMSLYIGMLVLLGILYQMAGRPTVCLVIMIYVYFFYYTEKSLGHFNTFDVFFKNFLLTGFDDIFVISNHN